MSGTESYSESEAEEPTEATEEQPPEDETTSEEQPAEDETTGEEQPAESPEEGGVKVWNDQGAPQRIVGSEAPVEGESGEGT